MEFYVSEQHEKQRRMFPHYNYGGNSEYYIFVCGHCKNEKRVRKMPYTGNMCTYWSDGRIEACNDWQISYMQRCPHCGNYYFVDINEAERGFGSEPLDDGRVDIVKVLLAAGANVNAFDEDGETALMMAAEEGRADVVQALIAGGANVNMMDHEGRTALQHARKEGRSHIVTILQNAGAQ